MLQAVYIADHNNRLTYEYLINLSSPKFVSLINTITLNQNDTAFHDELPLIEINTEFFVVFQKTKNLIVYILCSNSNNPNPITPFIFIQRLIEVMGDYFGTPLALTKIDANNDTLTVLINEMIDDGLPNVTDCNKLRDLIPFKSLLSKFLSTSNELANAASKKSLGSLTHPQRTQSMTAEQNSLNSIPWRKSNVKYTNNEMYVDVVETINVILKPTNKISANKKNLLSSNNHFDSAYYSTNTLLNLLSQLIPIVGTIDGQVNFVSHLTGIPLLQLVLTLGGLDICLPSLHQCINLGKWLDNPGTLSFIPPDGSSTLMSYQIDLDSMHKKDQLNMLGLIAVDYASGLGTNKNEFEIRLIIQNVKTVSKIENLTVEIVCDTSDEDSDEESAVTNIKASRITHGDLSFKGHGRAEWNLRNISSGIQPVLHGSIVTNHSDDSGSDIFSNERSPDLIDFEGAKERSNSPRLAMPIAPTYVRLSYSHKGSIPSGIKVDSLKIVSAKGLGETVKPYKGVKYVTKTGNFIIRS